MTGWSGSAEQALLIFWFHKDIDHNIHLNPEFWQISVASQHRQRCLHPLGTWYRKILATVFLLCLGSNSHRAIVKARKGRKVPEDQAIWYVDLVAKRCRSLVSPSFQSVYNRWFDYNYNKDFHPLTLLPQAGAFVVSIFSGSLIQVTFHINMYI